MTSTLLILKIDRVRSFTNHLYPPLKPFGLVQWCSNHFCIVILLIIARKHKYSSVHFTFQTTVRDFGVTWESALTFSQHISNLTRSSYIQLRRLRTIRKAVSVPIFTSIVHVFVCSRIDYCNSLLVGFPKPRLSPDYLPFRLYSTRLRDSLPDFPVTPIYLLH